LWFYADLRFEPGYYNGDHEPWLQEFLEESLDEGDCFYDIGAHTGFFALIAARLVGDRGLVLALEPDPRNAEVLRANLERNHMHQVKLMEAAAWSSSGKVTFQQDYDASNRTQGHITLGAAADSREITVPAVSLDELVFGGGQRPPDLIKMDVEGAEGEALQGVARTLREVKPTLLCEVHNPAMLDQCRAFLGECGYSVESWAPVHPHCPDCRQHYLKACVSP
jgi:FkbM family methyltransferase